MAHDPQLNYISLLEKQNVELRAALIRHKEDYFAISGTCSEMREKMDDLKALFPDAKKLNWLATWFDRYDEKHKATDNEVQEDLRRWAKNATKAKRIKA